MSLKMVYVTLTSTLIFLSCQKSTDVSTPTQTKDLEEAGSAPENHKLYGQVVELRDKVRITIYKMDPYIYDNVSSNEFAVDFGAEYQKQLYNIFCTKLGYGKSLNKTKPSSIKTPILDNRMYVGPEGNFISGAELKSKFGTTKFSLYNLMLSPILCERSIDPNSEKYDTSKSVDFISVIKPYKFVPIIKPLISDKYEHPVIDLRIYTDDGTYHNDVEFNPIYVHPLYKDRVLQNICELAGFTRSLGERIGPCCVSENHEEQIYLNTDWEFIFGYDLMRKLPDLERDKKMVSIGYPMCE